MRTLLASLLVALGCEGSLVGGARPLPPVDEESPAFDEPDEPWSPSSPSEPTSPTTPAEPLTPEARTGVELYGRLCASCHKRLDESVKRGRTAPQIDAALQTIDLMQPLRALLSADDVAALAAALYVAPSEPPFRCEPTAVATSRIQRLSNREYVGSLEAVFGALDPTIPTDSALRATLARLPTDVQNGKEDTRLVDATLVSVQSDAAFRLGQLVSASNAALRAVPGTNGCLTGTSVSASCVDSFINGLGARLLRRPLTAAELTSQRALWNAPTNTTNAERITVVVAALSLSPDFLYQLYDSGTPSGANRTQLDAWALASRLSLRLTGLPPDAALSAAAASGAVRDPVVLRAQARRLLATPAGEATQVRFFKEWLHYDRFDAFQYPAALLAGLDVSTLRQAMVAEIDAYVVDAVRQRVTFEALLTSTSTRFSSPALAQVYGVADPRGAVTQLPASQRAGLLTRAAFLTKRSGWASSPVARGHFVLQEVLCDDVAAPPANVVTALPGLPPGEFHTTRARLEAHTEAPGSVCLGCHRRLNPLGYPFEHYDSVGRSRTAEALFDATGRSLDRSLPVDTRATTSDVTGIPVTVRDALELSRALAASKKAKACLTRRWFEFVERRTGTAADGCALSKGLDALEAGSIADLLEASVLEANFTHWSI